MNYIKEITIYSNAPEETQNGQCYQITLNTASMTILYRDLIANGKSIRSCNKQESEILYRKLVDWMQHAEVGSATYYGNFSDNEKYDEWRRELCFEDSDIRWCINCEYGNGGIVTYICIEDKGCPAPVMEIADYMKKLATRH